ncbi:PREDICTED: ubiquitin-conjugating enzyme E2 Q2-like [Cercocebus atys]|uniref:ubiquitin-conjugating enzyme E2 Q2-like n=1 Tax=Cercocebus atys TaxID=9531 RepID=UPI0005F4DDB4|nr:PREDICTED: ubiquitin-conjugating enzyme E2 Q2-like [Cercocebus atys]
MSVSGFKAKLKLLASTFHKNQEPQWRLMLHCNRTVRRPAAASRGRPRAERGRPESRDKEEPAPERPGFSAPFSLNWTCPARGLREVWVAGGGGRVFRRLAPGWLGGCWILLAPAAAPRGGSPRKPEPSRDPRSSSPWQILSLFQNGTTEEVTSDEEEEEEEEMAEDIEDLDHYEMKEEPISGEKLEDEGIEKENLAILEKIRQDHLNAAVSGSVQASGRLMTELRDIYKSQNYKTAKDL